MITEVLTRRDALGTTRPQSRTAPLGDGEAYFAVESFALTANNVTYAAHGVDMRYWDFYPAPQGWGIVPVWGFARCVESCAEGIAVGDRAYGYWPFADGAVLRPAKAGRRGFVDAAAHRGDLPSVYNGYARVTPAMADEAAYALFRPLFLTSFALDAALAGAAATVLLSSASSKTALGLAQLMQARGDVFVVGLTSAGNREFVAATGYYDRVLAYDEIATAAFEGSVAYADFAGDGGLRATIHAAFGDRLTRSIVIGDTHWDVSGATARLPGPRPEFFFAPTVLAEQIGALGQAAFDARVEAGWTAFVASTAPWLRIATVDGLDAAAAAWTRLAGGAVDPAAGLIVRPGGGASATGVGR